LLDRHLGEDWWRHASDAGTWAALDEVPDSELWRARCDQRAELVEFVKQRSGIDRLAERQPRAEIEAAARAFDPEVLTIGFAGRNATYKRRGGIHLTQVASGAPRAKRGPRQRAQSPLWRQRSRPSGFGGPCPVRRPTQRRGTPQPDLARYPLKRIRLLIQDPARALGLLGGPYRIQLLLAGKAHPSDDEAKRIVQELYRFKDVPEVTERVVFCMSTISQWRHGSCVAAISGSTSRARRSRRAGPAG
jgi:glucan phosphorylase